MHWFTCNLWTLWNCVWMKNKFVVWKYYFYYGILCMSFIDLMWKMFLEPDRTGQFGMFRAIPVANRDVYDTWIKALATNDGGRAKERKRKREEGREREDNIAGG